MPLVVRGPACRGRKLPHWSSTTTSAPTSPTWPGRTPRSSLTAARWRRAGRDPPCPRRTGARGSSSRAVAERTASSPPPFVNESQLAAPTHRRPAAAGLRLTSAARADSSEEGAGPGSRPRTEDHLFVEYKTASTPIRPGKRPLPARNYHDRRPKTSSNASTPTRLAGQCEAQDCRTASGGVASSRQTVKQKKGREADSKRSGRTEDQSTTERPPPWTKKAEGCPDS